MSPKRAKAIAGLIRREHGEFAERFIANQIRHFQQEAPNGNAVTAWRLVLRALASVPVGPHAYIQSSPYDTLQASKQANGYDAFSSC